jgi:photosystem II stability/assembly factor-like uncharacterized protein
MKLQSKYKFLFISFLLLFIAHCTLNIEDCKSQWVYQALPTYVSVGDIKFFDANTGILIYTSGMYRTTNGGFNWTLINNNESFFEMQLIDSVTIYTIGRGAGAIDRIRRTFDRGLTWDSVAGWWNVRWLYWFIIYKS